MDPKQSPPLIEAAINPFDPETRKKVDDLVRQLRGNKAYWQATYQETVPENTLDTDTSPTPHSAREETARVQEVLGRFTGKVSKGGRK